MKFDIGMFVLLSSVAQAATEANSTKPSKPRCPTRGNYCQDSEGKDYSFGFDYVPECWELKNGINFDCAKKVNGKCSNVYSVLDVSTCPGFIPSAPKCPKIGAPCLDEFSTAYKFGSANIPECWEYFGDGILCTRKKNGACNFGGLALDVSTCPGYNKNSPACPKPNQKCLDSYNRSYTLKDKNVPKCWKKGTYNTFTCRNPSYNNKCDNNEVDVFNCPKY